MPRVRDLLPKAPVTLAAVLMAGAPALSGELADRSMQETDPPFGGAANVAYAEGLWSAMREADLVGPDSIRSYPYSGNDPHGLILTYLETEFGFEGTTGSLMVKKNYVKGDLSEEDAEAAILNEGRERLDSVTIMFRRQAGYDPDNADWFWAKYAPDGSLAENPKGMQLGGRVAKGAAQGCIACHQAAPGGDYVYTHDRWADD
jgi:hypothetical protein